MNRRLLLLVIVLLAAVALPAGWAAAGPTAAPVSFVPGEPSDTFAAAIPFDLYGNHYVDGYFLTAADVDFYRLDPVTPVTLWAQVETGQAFGHTSMTAEIALYDANQALLAENKACADPAIVDGVTVPEGAAYARVRPCAGALDIDRPYQLTIYSDAVEMEPNNTRQTANGALIPYNEYADYNQYLTAAVAPAGDVDFYHVQGPAGQAFTARIYAADGTPPLSLALMKSDGTVVAEGAPCWYDAGDTCLDAVLPDGATYYLRARSATHPTGGGDYSLYTALETNTFFPEPNNTPAQAPLIGYGTSIDVDVDDDESDVDFYRFNGQAGEKVRLVILDDFEPADYPGILEIELFDPAMNPLPLAGEPVFRGTLPADGLYTLKVGMTPYSADYLYLNLVVDRDEGGEPNDTRDTATPIAIGPQLNALFDYPCDVDWFRFNGRAGDVVRFVNTDVVDENVYLYAADGTLLDTHVLPADGVYYLRAVGYYGDKWDNYCYDGPEARRFAEALWVSAAVDGLGGNAAIKAGDIATRQSAAGKWQIVFDASDVGLTKNVLAFDRLPNGSILMSLAAGQIVPGLGKVMPHDIIRFIPTALGDTTAGTFQWFLDGSDVGLTLAGEKIDAISMQEDIENPLRISTTGSGAVPRTSGGTLKFADEDILNLVGGVFGANSAGTWRMSLDGSTVPGLAAEDVSNLARVEVNPARDSTLLVGLDSAFVVNGTRGTVRDVLNGDTWQTAVQQLTDKKIDGLAVGPVWTP